MHGLGFQVWSTLITLISKDRRHKGVRCDKNKKLFTPSEKRLTEEILITHYQADHFLQQNLLIESRGPI